MHDGQGERHSKDDLFRQVISLYDPCSYWTRVFVRARLRVAPFRQIAQYVPQGGSVLDIGCGHGIFSNLLALSSPTRNVTGVDVQESKIIEATRTIQNRDNISFMICEVTEGPLLNASYDAVTMIDLLHHIPSPKQGSLIQSIHDILSEDGTLVIKDVDTQPLWKLSVSYLHDTIINGCWGQLYFISSADLETLLNKTGFEVKSKIFFRFSPYAHVLYVCKRSRDRIE